MIKAPVSLQDLRYRLYVKAKAIGPVTLDAKCAGARSAGNPHAACDAAGAGDGATASPIRARRGKPRTQPRTILRATAPVPDPTGVPDVAEFADEAGRMGEDAFRNPIWSLVGHLNQSSDDIHLRWILLGFSSD